MTRELTHRTEAAADTIRLAGNMLLAAADVLEQDLPTRPVDTLHGAIATIRTSADVLDLALERIAGLAEALQRRPEPNPN